MRALCILMAVFLTVFGGCDNNNVDSNQEISAQKVHESKQPQTASAGNKDGQGINTELNNQDQVKSDSFKPFYVYQDKGSRENHYIPSGFMPNGKCVYLDDKWQEQCNSGTTCMRLEYDVECSRKDQKWAGIYWLNPPNNWGQRKGGYNLVGASKLTFWAKGQDGGEQIQEITVGGITGDYPDTDTAVIGPVILSTEWKKYSIDLRGKDLSYISGGFAWTTSEDVNGDTCVFYLDEIRFE